MLTEPAGEVRVTALLPRYAVSVSDAHPNHYGNMVPVEHCQRLLDRALAIINDAILHGMPVTEEVAEVSNLIRGTKYSGDTVKVPAKEAYDWLTDNTEKREKAVAVKYQDIQEKVPKPPTFNGKVITNGDYAYKFLELSECRTEQRFPQLKCCMVWEENNWQTKEHKRVVYPADQLTELQQERLRKQVEEYLEARSEHKKLRLQFNSLLENVKNVEVAIPVANWALLKRVRKSMATNLAKRTRLATKLAEINSRYASQLWKTKKVNNGVCWMIGGWCAS